MTLYGELQLREKTGNPIKVGVIGAGQMGRGMIAQIVSIPGMIVTGISDFCPLIMHKKRKKRI